MLSEKACTSKVVGVFRAFKTHVESLVLSKRLKVKKKIIMIIKKNAV